MAYRKQIAGSSNRNNSNRKSLTNSQSRGRSNINRQFQRRRRGGRRQNRRRGGRGMFYVETFSFSTQAGNKISITVKDLVNRPKSSNFRVRYLQVIASITSMTNVAIQPATIDVRLQNSAVGDGSFVAASGPVLLGVNPKSVKVYTPRSTDWLAYNEAASVAIGEIHFGCLAKDKTVGVSGLAHMLIDFGPEMLPGSCPALQPTELFGIPVETPSIPSLSQLELSDSEA